MGDTIWISNLTNPTAPSVLDRTLAITAPFTDSLINAVFVPFGPFTDQLDAILDADDSMAYVAENWSDIITAQSGLAAAIILGLIYVVAVPIAGFIVACSECCCLKKCQSNSKCCSCCGLFNRIATGLSALLVILGGILILVANSHTEEAMSTLPDEFNATADIPSAYLSNVKGQLDSYFSDYVQFTNINMDQLTDEQIGENTKSIVEEAFAPTRTEIESTINDVTNIFDSFETILAEFDTAKASADELAVNIASFKAANCNCVAVNVVCDALCVELTFDTSLLDQAYTTMDTVKGDLDSSDLSSVTVQIDGVIDDIPTQINTMTADLETTLIADGGALNEANKTILDGKEKLKTSIDDVTNQWETLTLDVDKLFDDVAEYNYYRNIVCIVIGALVIVIGLLALIGALPIKKGVSVGFLRASVAISFIFSWLFMLIVIVVFVAGGVLTRYGCQAFKPNGQDMEGLVYVENMIDASFEFDGQVVEINLNQAIQQCGQNKGFATALGLETLVDDFIDGTDVEGQIDAALEMINTTYDDLVNDFKFSDYTGDLENFELPADIDSVVTELNDAIEPLTDLEDSLDNLDDQFSGDSWNNIKTLITSVSNTMGSITTDATSLVAEAKEINVAGIMTKLNDLETELKGDSQVKNDIYAESSFIKQHTLSFIDQFSDSLVNDFGACQPIYQTYDNVLILLCSYIVDALNALWFALGWSSFFLLLLLVFGHQLSLLIRHATTQPATYNHHPQAKPRSKGSKARVGPYESDTF